MIISSHFRPPTTKSLRNIRNYSGPIRHCEEQSDEAISGDCHVRLGGLAMTRIVTNILSKKQTEKGFTMIEMLVVIAIILILAALLFPFLRGAMETARQTKCMSNLRQLGIATFTYAADNNGRGPFNDSTYHKVTGAGTHDAPGYIQGPDGYFTSRSRDSTHPSFRQKYTGH